MEHFYEIKNLSVGYKTLDGNSTAVDNVSMYVDGGEIVGIVGESGSGKSQTQLAALQLIPIPPAKIEGGAVYLQGENLLEHKANSDFIRSIRGGKIGMIFQEPMTSLNPVKTIGKQIMESVILHCGKTPEEAKARAIDLLEQVGITDAASRLDDYPHQFSGGMRQRIMIAIALAGNPEMIIADEPTTALDVTTQAQILDLLESLAKKNGAALIIITHNLGIVAKYANRIYVMYAGNIVESGSTMDIFKSPSHPYTRGLLKAVPVLSGQGGRLTPIDGTPPSPVNRQPGCQFKERCKYAAHCKGFEKPVELRTVGENHLSACCLSPAELNEIESSWKKDEQFSKAEPLADVVLKAEGVNVAFPIRKGLFQKQVGMLNVLQDVNFELHKRETLGLVGESGCGKTTTAKAVLKLLDEAAGKVWLGDTDILSIPEKEFRKQRRRIQMIFQDPYSSLDPRQTAGSIVGEALKEYKLVNSTKEYDERVDELFRMVGLEPSMRDRVAHEFSGGQRQRIGIARALACEPEIIICDEPISALDVSIQAQIVNLLEDLQNELGLSYLFVAHDLSVVKHISHRVAVMYLGTIVELTSSEDLYRNPLHPYTKALMDAVPIPDPEISRNEGSKILNGEVPSIIHRPEGCPFRNRCNMADESCALSIPKLKDMGSGHFAACHKL